MVAVHHLHVRSGCHAGASVALDKPRYLLGRDAGCDIVLCDAAVADRHLEIARDGRCLYVSAHDAGVGVGDGDRIEPGYRARLTDTSELDLGGVALTLDMPGRRFEPMLPLAGVLGLALVTGLGALALWPQVPVEREAAVRPATPVMAAPKANTATALRDVAAASDLSEQLSALGIDTLDVRLDDNRFVLTGNLGVEALASFEEFHHWFDTRFPDYVLEAARVDIDRSPTAPARTPTIESAWHIDRAYIVVEGLRYYTGDTLPGGWLVKSIEPRQTKLEHDGKTYAVQLATAQQTAATKQ